MKCKYIEHKKQCKNTATNYGYCLEHYQLKRKTDNQLNKNVLDNFFNSF